MATLNKAQGVNLYSVGPHPWIPLTMDQKYLKKFQKVDP